MTAHILVIDDEPDIRDLMREILEDEGFTVSVAKDGKTARRLRTKQPPDLILLDIWMPDIDGISLLKEWRESGLLQDSPVIMLSGHGTVETAVESTRLGAYDFIEKPLSISKLLLTIERALKETNLLKEPSELREQSVIEPLGHSKIMLILRDQANRINLHNTSILIIGEPGSGRTLFARYIHQSGKKGPFINMQVAGMTTENQAIELFGSQENIARLEQAESGTLFIKDIANLDSVIQLRLLSSLKNHSFLRTGSREPISLNIRIIAAITAESEIKNLHEDLYYHLNVVSLKIPPLREHCEDVPELLEYYVNFFVNKDNLPYRRFTVAAQNMLRNYIWPGNILELKNLVQRLLILGNTNTIDIGEVEPTLEQQPTNNITGNSSIYDLPLRDAREQFEKAYLEYQLQETGGNVSKMATKIGLERTHLYRKLRALNIDPKQLKK
ncbi:MAG: sigma-54-dependent Fis family transcriptional regulator [Candidatus Marithrix sp.]|nr:sigma-54-dependent Fis family transcriptional regulator [Candidatus Marithrix sp.]